MKEVKCPKCDAMFEMDASGYADIVKQIRSEEFENELEMRLNDLESNHSMKLELAQQSIAAEKDREILVLRNQIDSHAREIEIATKDALKEVQQELFGHLHTFRLSTQSLSHCLNKPALSTSH